LQKRILANERKKGRMAMLLLGGNNNAKANASDGREANRA
jgi:hypothetical protein